MDILRDLFDDNGTSSSDESEDLNVGEDQEKEIPRATPKVLNFMNIVERYNDKEFQQQFRISRTRFQALVNRLAPSLERAEGSCGRLCTPIDQQVLAVIWLLATPDSYRSVAGRFNLSKSTLFMCFYKVVASLNEIAPIIIKWPNQNDRQNIKASFRRIAGLPGVVGAIDGTYVPIKAPRQNPEVYANRKCFHGITLQAICTPHLMFIDCFTGYPSSVSDIRIFRNSDIYTAIQNNIAVHMEADEHIIGDKAYPTLNWCIPPHIDRGNLTERQRKFNSVHAKTRQVIERAFALLFGRFRRLRYLDMNRIDLIPSTIIGACVLHNWCLLGEEEIMEEYINEGYIHMAEVAEREIAGRAIVERQDINDGHIKRNYLTTLIP